MAEFDKEAAFELSKAAKRVADAIETAKAKGERGTSFAPSDQLFSNPTTGTVSENATPDVFKDALLAQRYRITSYIQSGTFGRGMRWAEFSIDTRSLCATGDLVSVVEEAHSTATGDYLQGLQATLDRQPTGISFFKPLHTCIPLYVFIPCNRLACC